MNEASLRQRLGDGTDPAVMSPQEQGEERERAETSHSFFCCSRSPRLCPPLVLLSCDGLMLQAGDSYALGAQPHPHLALPGSSLVIFPGPALPCLFQPHRLWLHSQESQFHAHALAHWRRKLLI